MDAIEQQATVLSGASPSSQNADASAQQLRSVKRTLERLWIISPERLWRLSIRLHGRGHWLLAFAVKQLNTMLYHNSLAPEALVGANIRLGHYSHGIVVNGNVEIGDNVKIWHNVTLTAGRRTQRAPDGFERGVPARIVIEHEVKIGANAVVIAPRGQSLRIGRAARIGAGASVTRDVPARATVISPPSRILPSERADESVAEHRARADMLSGDLSDAAFDAAEGPMLGEESQVRPGRDASQRQ